MTHGKTYNKSPRRINHKATKSKTNTGTTGLIWQILKTEIMKFYHFFFCLLALAKTNRNHYFF